jgi:large subunit ribosomal protein L3
MKFIIGKKQEMTQVWQGDKVVAVTKVAVGPCSITQLKTKEVDGYEAVQLGFGERKVKNINKPQIAHLKKANVDTTGKKTLHHLREFTGVDITKDLELGDIINADTFEVGDKIQVVGTSKGRGFQGVVKRHGFHGTNEQHGNKDQSRMPGSIGATGPAHVFKGTKMGGRMGNDRVTMKILEIIQVDIENNFVFVKGGIPGARNGVVLISGEGELKVTKTEKKTKSEEAVKPKTEDKKNKEDKAPVDTAKKVEKEVVEAKEKVEAKEASEKESKKEDKK